jgi:hypothetical protein
MLPLLRTSAAMFVAGLMTSAHADDREATRTEPVVSAVRIPRELAAVIGPGFYIAGRTAHLRVKPDPVHEVDEAFYIARLDRSGLRQIVREQEPGGAPRGGIGMVWVTPTTLVTSDFGTSADDRGAFSIITMAGTAAPKIESVTLRDADWKLTKAEQAGGVDNVAVPLLTRTGEVWLAMCLMKRHDRCERSRYLRVFGGTRTISDRKPAEIVSGRVASEFLRRSPDNVRPDVSSNEDPLAGLPNLRPGTGVSVVVRKARRGESSGGFECTVPGGSHTSPEDDIARDPLIPTRPETVRWVVSKPPVFAISGMATDPHGRVGEYVEYYRACSNKPMDGFRWLRPRIWAENVTAEHPGKRWIHHEWRLSIDDVVIGTLAGDAIQLAIAPP